MLGQGTQVFASRGVGLIICALGDCVGKLLNILRLDVSVVEDSEFTFELLLVLEDLFTALN